MWNNLVLIVGICVSGFSTADELFSSTAHINRMAQNGKLMADFENYLQLEKQRLDTLLLLKDWLSTTLREHRDTIAYVEHPVGAYHVIKMLRSMKHLTKAMADNNIRSALDYEGGFYSSLPTDEDYDGAANAIIRLQRVYKIMTSELIAGKVKGHQVSMMNEEDMVKIGTVAYTFSGSSHESIAIEWLLAALNSIVSNNADPSVHRDYKSILLMLAHSFAKLADSTPALDYLGLAKKFYPNDPDVPRYREAIMKSLETKRPPKSKNVYDTYEQLCRGDEDGIVHRPAAVEICRYKSMSAPYRRVKEEVLSFDPYASIFYDCISDREAELIKQIGFDTMIRAHVGYSKDASLTSKMRVSKVAWLDAHSDLSHRLTNRLREITGLEGSFHDSMANGEQFQIVNYGIGGQYEPHFDSVNFTNYLQTPGKESQASQLKEFIIGTGDRFATFLFYLNDVKEGGSTVFPSAGLRIKAVKNSAAFWYNLLPSGRVNPLSLHAACPVLLGQKWVCNKWFREYGQEFRKPCGLSQECPFNFKETDFHSCGSYRS